MSGVQLVCLPHAGGGASTFARWARLVGPGVTLVRPQLPGREERAGEPRPRRVADVVAELFAAVPPGPVALYGHSMGALLAYELARVLEEAGAGPEHLFVSGRRAPHRLASRPPLHAQPEPEFLAGLVTLGGTPPDVATSAIFRRHALGLVRDDLRLVETHVHRPGAPLGCPVTAFVGHGDPVVDPDEVLAWSEITTGPFAAHHLTGDHFFHQQHRDVLARVISGALTSHAAEAPA